MKNHLLIAFRLFCLFFTVSGLGAAPLSIDTPLRDPAICRGPDGLYYLTGTTEGTVDGRTGFHNNPGARVWTSPDLATWTDLGYVFDTRDLDPRDRSAGVASRWQTEFYPVPGLEPGVRGRGMTAPRLSFDGERFWLTHSMNGYAAGALPSEGADVRGPYIDTRLIVEAGGSPTGQNDATLFIDRDGTRYLVWGGGTVARLKSVDQMIEDFGIGKRGKIGEGAVGVEGPRTFIPTVIEGFYTDLSLPEHGAPYGASIVLDGETYRFIYSATTYRDGGIHEDAYVASSNRLLGPYSKPQLLAPDAGRVSAFKDGDGRWQLVFTPTGSGQPQIAVLPSGGSWQISPAKAAAHDGSRAKPASAVTIAKSIPVPQPSEKPDDVEQLLEFIEPLFDHPLRDAALARAPDGTWYLTGTEASLAGDGTLDWANNKGIRLWSSPDRENWTDLGYVWEIERDGDEWAQRTHLDLTVGAQPQIGRAVTAPEIHFVNGACYIVYSMNGQGVGILRSRNGSPEGPYDNLGQVLRTGRDPSLFVEGSQVSLIWGQGLLAPLNDTLTAIDGRVKTLFTDVRWFPRYTRRPEVLGQWGSNLLKAGDVYVWSFTTRTGRLGNNSIDTLASWSNSLDGPWADPCLMIANGGQSTLVPDGEGKYFATVSGEDEYAYLPYLPAITQVARLDTFGDMTPGDLSELQPLRENHHSTNHTAVSSLQATELDFWIGHPELIPFYMRDIWMDRFSDGYYYTSGSFWNVKEWADQVPFYRSTDKMHWEPVPGSIFNADRLAEVEGFDLAQYEKLSAERKQRNRTPVQLFEMKGYEWEGNVYASFAVERMSPVLLKADSMTDRFEPLRLTGFSEFHRLPDGTFLECFPSAFVHIDSLGQLESGDYNRRDRIRVNHHQNVAFMEDVETGIVEMEGKYVTWSTDWTGSYDMNYMVADDWRGPWSNLRVGVPHGGNGMFFQDDEGWWYAYFMNNNDYATRPTTLQKLHIMPIHVGWRGSDLIIEPKAVRPNRERLEKLGPMWQMPVMGLTSQ